MKYLKENNSLADQYKDWANKERGVDQSKSSIGFTTEEHRTKQEEFENILKNVFMMFIEDDDDNSTENVEWHRENDGAQSLADHLIDRGEEDAVKNIIKSNFHDRNGVSIRPGDTVIFKEEAYDNGMHEDMELTISDIATDNLGCFTTYEFDSRYFSFTEVEKKMD